jgi:hypothetical protein
MTTVIKSNTKMIISSKINKYKYLKGKKKEPLEEADLGGGSRRESTAEMKGGCCFC